MPLGTVWEDYNRGRKSSARRHTRPDARRAVSILAGGGYAAEMQQAQKIGDGTSRAKWTDSSLRYIDIVDSILRIQSGHAPERPQDYFRLAARRPRRVRDWSIAAAYGAAESHGVIISICPPLLPRAMIRAQARG